MYPLKIGIQLVSLRMPLKESLLTAARLGAQGVEIDARHSIRPEELSQTGLRHLKKLLDDLNLRVCAVGFRTRHGYHEPQELERRIEGTKKAMRMAYQLGAHAVVNHVGQVPNESQGAEWDLLIQSLSDIGQFGQHIGARLAAETGTEEGQRLADLIAALPPGSLAINFDPGNLIVHGFDPRRALDLLAEHVVHIHATDGVRDLARGRGHQTLLGRGSADFPEWIGILEEYQYRGYFTIERETSEDPVKEIGLAVRYLQNVMEG